MKTKCTFTPEDFNGSGQLIIRDSSPTGSKDYGFAITVCYKIGYIPSQAKHHKHGSMISMADGMVNHYETLEELCEHLNSDTHGYRPMTKTEIINIIGGHGSRFPE